MQNERLFHLGRVIQVLHHYIESGSPRPPPMQACIIVYVAFSISFRMGCMQCS